MNGWLGNELPAENVPSMRGFGAAVIIMSELRSSFGMLDDFGYSQKH